MFLLSPILLKKFRFSINFTYFLRVFPYKWNDATQQIDCTDESSPCKVQFRTWKILNLVILFNGVFLTAGYCQELAEFTTDKFGDFVVATLIFLAFSTASFLQFFIRIRGRKLALCCNRFIKYFLELQGKVL